LARPARAKAERPSSSAPPLRIATYNVNGVNGRLSNLLDWLGETEPDVVCLQELKSEGFPTAALEKAGYGAIWHGQKSWNGVAILGRGVQPIETRRGLPDDPPGSQSRYIEAAVKGLLVGCLYAPNGNPVGSAKYAAKEAWYARFMAHADGLLATEHPVALVGDYNIIPTDFDVYAPERWRDDALFQPSLKATFAELKDRGWTDAIRAVFPDERVYTFWKYWRNAFQRDAGLRIDHFLLSPALAPRLTTAGVDRDTRGRDGASDHAPVWIEVSR
jgi:exodeoxyribonuclease-3